MIRHGKNLKCEICQQEFNGKKQCNKGYKNNTFLYSMSQKFVFTENVFIID